MCAAVAAQDVSGDAARLPIHDVARYLQEHLGQRATAYLSGVNDPKMVSHWIARRNVPRDGAKMRLREAYQAVRLLLDAYDDEIVAAWLSCSSADLGDRSPAYVLRCAESWEDLRFVLPAARAFARGASRPSA